MDASKARYVDDIAPIALAGILSDQFAEGDNMASRQAFLVAEAMWNERKRVLGDLPYPIPRN
jgi:hypothetical protein